MTPLPNDYEAEESLYKMERTVREAEAEATRLRAENVRLRAALRGIDRRIGAFDRECKAAEYTDTGEAWEVLWACRGEAGAALKRGGAK